MGAKNKNRKREYAVTMQQLLIRLDDIAPAMNWERFERLEALFEQYHIRPVIGVVPDCRDPKLCVQSAREDFWEKMRALWGKGWTVAQHGFQHDYVTAESGMLGINRFSEFAGLSVGEQYRKLKKGQEILHNNGICATMFMAPGHTYDKNTLKALKKLGFTCVTDGYCSRPYRRQGLVFLPCTLAHPQMPKRFDTLCIHLNHMTDGEFDELARFIAGHREMIGDARDYAGVCGTKQASPVILPDTLLGMPMNVKPRIPVASYSVSMLLEEHTNLFKRRMKRFAAENATLQEYFCRTDDARTAVKRGKRILGAPGLLVRLLIHRK